MIMQRFLRNIRTLTFIFMLGLAGLVISGTAFADWCVDNGDGTITDNNSGLMWQTATAGPMDWDQAMNYASGLSLGGHSDWRMPTKFELVGLFHSPCKDMMDVRDDNYWSSTSHSNDSNLAWHVYFGRGYVGSFNKSHPYYVRAVRSAQ